MDSKHGPKIAEEAHPKNKIPMPLRLGMDQDQVRSMLTVWDNSTKFRRIVCEVLNKMILSEIKNGKDATGLMLLRSMMTKDELEFK